MIENWRSIFDSISFLGHIQLTESTRIYQCELDKNKIVTQLHSLFPAEYKRNTEHLSSLVNDIVLGCKGIWRLIFLLSALHKNDHDLIWCVSYWLERSNYMIMWARRKANWQYHTCKRGASGALGTMVDGEYSCLNQYTILKMIHDSCLLMLNCCIDLCISSLSIVGNSSSKKFFHSDMRIKIYVHNPIRKRGPYYCLFLLSFFLSFFLRHNLSIFQILFVSI